MQKLANELLTISNETRRKLSEMLPGADVSPAIDQSIYGALEGLDGLRKACSAHLLARRVQEALQGDSALLAESVVINEVGFTVDPVQKTISEEVTE
jgi:hypothetical protein